MLPDQVAGERSHLWEDGVLMDVGTVSRTDIGNGEDSLCQGGNGLLRLVHC